MQWTWNRIGLCTVYTTYKPMLTSSGLIHQHGFVSVLSITAESILGLRHFIRTRYRWSIISSCTILALKTRFNGNFFIWQCKGDYWVLNKGTTTIRKKYLCSFNWRFWRRKILQSKLPRTNLTMPEVSCGVTWSIPMALRGIRHSEFAVGKSPRRIADWAERILFR